MVKDLRHSKSTAINGHGSYRGSRSSDVAVLGEISKPLILSMLMHALALGGLLVAAPYLSAPKLSLPPAQMVQLVDLPSGGAGDAPAPIHDRTPVPPKPPDASPEAPKAENPPAPKLPEPPPEKIEKAPPPKPKEPLHTPEMALPAPKPKEPAKKEPPKREEKKPEPAPRAAAEKPPEKKLPAARPTPPEPTPRRETTARAQPERTGPGGGGRPGPGSGPGNSLALGGGSGMLSLDSANFPFTYYLRQVTGRIEENWVRPQQNLGRVVVYFQIKRDGTIVEPQIKESSRNQAVDWLASGAIRRSEPFPPLPTEFGGDYLGIYLCFGLGGACPGQKEG